MQFYDNAQIDALNQRVQNKFVKIEILDFNYKTLDTIEGNVESGSINEDANNDCRKNVTLSIIVPPIYSDVIQTQFGQILKSNTVKDKFSIQRGSLIWLDRYIKIYVGIKSLKRTNGELPIIWYNRGIFIMDSPSLTWSMNENRLDIQGIDLMSQFTEERYGQLTGMSTTITALEYTYNSQGEIITKKKNKLRESLISVLMELGGIQNYFIAPIPTEFEFIPIDIRINVGGTVYDLLTKIRDLLPNWEMFFDEDGVFRFQPIPDGENDMIYPLNNNNTIIDNISVNFNNVKNHIIIYGKFHSGKYYIENSAITPNAVDYNVQNKQLILTIANFEIPIEVYTIIKFKWVNKYSTEFTTVVINGKSYQLVNFEKPNSSLPVDLLEPNKTYVIRYITDGIEAPLSPTFEFLSSDQVIEYIVEDNPLSPYYINYFLTGENYYGGRTKSFSNRQFNIVLNNTKPLTTISIGTKISFMPNTFNIFDPLFQIYNKEGEQLKPLTLHIGNYKNGIFTPLIADKWTDDFTIYYAEYSFYVDNFGEKIDYLEYKGKLKTLVRIFAGGEFDSIYSNRLAYERVLYERYLHSNLNDSVNITTIPNFIMTVNKKINYINQINGIKSSFLIKALSLPLGIDDSGMSINAMQLYGDPP